MLSPEVNWVIPDTLPQAGEKGNEQVWGFLHIKRCQFLTTNMLIKHFTNENFMGSYIYKVNIHMFFVSKANWRLFRFMLTDP